MPMFFKNFQLVIYLKSYLLQVANYKENLEPLVFPKELVSHQEIRDFEKFKELLRNYLGQFDLKKEKYVIVLAPELIYQKEILLEEDKDPQKRIESFFSHVPFDVEHVAKMQYEEKDRLVLFGTNQSLYQTVIDVFDEFRADCLGVIPAPVIGDFSQSELLENDEVNQVFDSSKLISETNFLKSTVVGSKTEEPTDSDEKEQEEEEEKNKSRKNQIMLVAAILMLIAAFGIILVSGNIIKNPFTSKKLPVEKAPLPTTEASSSAKITQASSSALPKESSISAVSKDKIKIQILNASGVSGQAAKVKDLLTPLGYSDFTLGNATKTPDTTLSFSSTVSSDEKNEITKTLEDSFSQVSQKEASSSAFDVSITLGLAK